MPVADFQDVQTIGIGIVAAVFIVCMVVSTVAVTVRHFKEKRTRAIAEADESWREERERSERAAEKYAEGRRDG